MTKECWNLSACMLCVYYVQFWIMAIIIGYVLCLCLWKRLWLIVAGCSCSECVVSSSVIIWFCGVLLEILCEHSIYGVVDDSVLTEAFIGHGSTRTGLFAETSVDVSLPDIGLDKASTLVTDVSTVVIDPEIEKKVLLVLCDISLDIPCEMSIIAHHTSRSVGRPVELFVVETLLKQFSADSLIRSYSITLLLISVCACIFCSVSCVCFCCSYVWQKITFFGNCE